MEHNRGAEEDPNLETQRNLLLDELQDLFSNNELSINSKSVPVEVYIVGYSDASVLGVNTCILITNTIDREGVNFLIRLMHADNRTQKLLMVEARKDTVTYAGGKLIPEDNIFALRNVLTDAVFSLQAVERFYELFEPQDDSDGEPYDDPLI